MSTNTTNMAMGKAVDGDNARTYLETTLGAALDKIDAHDHSGTTHGIGLTSVVIATGGLRVSAGHVGIGAAPDRAGLFISGTVTAVSTLAAALEVNMTAGAAVNTDNLVGLYVAPVYSPNGYTSTVMRGIWIAASTVAGTTAGKYGMYIGAQTGANTNNYGLYIEAPSGASGDNVGLLCAGAVRFSSLAARVAGDVYVIVDANGNLHKSALGPAS